MYHIIYMKLHYLFYSGRLEIVKIFQPRTIVLSSRTSARVCSISNRPFIAYRVVENSTGRVSIDV